MIARAQTHSGVLVGEIVDGGVARFLGVPYARPPVGALRWRAPEPVVSWDGERSAKSYGPASMQPPFIPATSYMYNGEREFDEDCLYLNVFTGSLEPAEKRPVIVFFHMGAFNFGSSGGPLTDGSGLAQAGAVVVAINYRLGRLGFLAHPALSQESPNGVSGNYGILDQIAALRWVRDNIAAFGGDPDCVTIYGVSAGSCSVSVHMASPLSAGLFHRAIGSSGGAFAPVSETGTHFAACFQSLAAAERSGETYMERHGARTVEEMRALPADVLLDLDFSHGPDFLKTVYPVVDGYVLPASPYDVFMAHQHNDVPLLTGSNAGDHLPGTTDAAAFEQRNRELLGDSFDDLVKVYPMSGDEQTSASTGDAGGDRVFTWQNWAWARMQAQHGNAPAFYYHFSYEPPIPPNRYAEQEHSPHMGAAHSIDMPYVWRNLRARDWPFQAIDHDLSDMMSSYWLNFARTGNPNGPGLPEWPKLDMANSRMMRFDRDSAVEPAPLDRIKERMAFWDQTFAPELVPELI